MVWHARGERSAVPVYSALEALGMILPLLCVTLPVSLIIAASVGIGSKDAMEHGMTVKGVSARSDVWQQRSWLCHGGLVDVSLQVSALW